MFIRDAAAAVSHETTPEGFLRLRARIGRTGVHDYRAEELGSPAGFGPGDRIRVFRPPEEVFDPASMASFAGKPVTDDHPPEMVHAGNWRRYAIGHSGEGVGPDGDHLVAHLFVADAAAAARAKAGAELSNGYHADFVFEPGTTPEGEPYDAVQRNIRGNHIALVDAGRCGGSCRVGDAADEPIRAAAPVGDAETVVDGRQHPSSGLSATISPGGRGDVSGKDCGCHDGLADLDALVAERTDVIDTARRLLGPSFAAAGRDTAAIRRLVVGRRLGEAAVRDRGDAYVAAAFDTLGIMQARTNPLATHLAVGLTDRAGGREAALAARDLHLTRAWQGATLHGDL